MSQSYNDDGKELDKELLWLFIPDFDNNGMLSSIKDIKDIIIDPKTKSVKFSKDKVYWKQHPTCSGFKISSDCPLRTSEMELVTYQPDECRTPNKKRCQELFAYARFDIKKQTQADGKY